MKDSSDLQSNSFFRKEQVSQIRHFPKTSKERTFNKSAFNVSFFRQEISENDEVRVIWGTNLNIDILKKQFT